MKPSKWLVYSIHLTILIGMLVFKEYSNYQLELSLKEKNEELLQSDKDINQALKIKVIEEWNSLNKSKQDYEELISNYYEKKTLLFELLYCRVPHISFAIGFSESRLRKNVVHIPEDPDRISPLSGIDLYFWNDKLKEANIDPNSLLAIDYVYLDYLARFGSHEEALKAYKGTKRNFYSFYLTQNFIEKIEKSKNYKKLLKSLNELQLLGFEKDLALYRMKHDI